MSIKGKIKGAFLLFGIIVSFVLAIALAEYIMTDYHEDVHKDIFTKWGIESTKFTSPNPFAQAYVDPDTDDYYAKCDSNCKLANEMNEVVGYNVAPIYYLMIFQTCLFSLFLLWIFLQNKKENKYNRKIFKGKNAQN